MNIITLIKPPKAINDAFPVAMANLIRNVPNTPTIAGMIPAIIILAPTSQ